MGSKTFSSGFNKKISINVNGTEVSSSNDLTDEQKEIVRKAMQQVKDATNNLGFENILPIEPKPLENKSKPVLVGNSNNKFITVALVIFAIYFVLKVVLKVW